MDKKIILNKEYDGCVKVEEINKHLNLPVYTFLKRIFDITMAILAIIILLPIFIIVGISIKLESDGPIIFKQMRIGKNSKPFYIYKFRSMKIDAPIKSTLEFKDSHKYITQIGKLIRKTSIDELPQLFNILKGEMSFVGPRPVIESEKELLNLREAYKVDYVLPGITGWAQINGRDEITDDEKAKYDYEYLIRRSVSFDAYIIYKTIFKVFKCEDIRRI